jgi:cytochrome c oxidase cbb3-type subunit 4
MNVLGANAIGVSIVMMLLAFVGIWLWAWLPYHKKSFDRLARMPMLDALPESEARGDSDEDNK